MGQKPDNLSAVLQSLLDEVKQSYDQLTAALGRLDYPFVADGEHMTIADYIADFLPQRNHCASDHQYYEKCGGIILDKLESIYARIISTLANIALTVDRLIPAINGQQINRQLNIQQNYLRENHVQDDHNQEKHNQENYSQEKHIQTNQIQTNQIQTNQSITADAAPKAAVSSSNSADLSLHSSAQSIELASEQEIATQPAIQAAAIAAGSDTVKTVPAKKEPRSKAPSATVESKALAETQSKKIVAPAAAEPRAKAVFTIDDPMDKVDEKAQPPAAETAVNPQGKAVFSIDDSKAEAATGDERKNSETVNASATAAEFAADLKPQSNELPADAKSSLEPHMPSAIDPLSKQTEQAGLSLESLGQSAFFEPQTAHVEATAEKTIPDEVKTPLSLEPVETLAETATPEIKSAAAADNLDTETEYQSLQDSLVMESKAEVLTFAPVEKSNQDTKPQTAANTKAGQGASRKLELENVEPLATTSNEQTAKSENENNKNATGNPTQAARS
jgi:hypothetical protein